MEMQTDAFSKKVVWYNFILCLLVVWVHAVNAADSSAALEGLAVLPEAGWDVVLENLLANGVAQLAVPGFFMLSACLFYRNLDSFSGIGKKWHSRLYSLLLPYLAWNAIYYLLHVFVMRDAPLSWQELILAASKYTYNPVFWYVYQLILLVLLAPVIYLLLKNSFVCLMALVGVLILIYFRVDLPLLNEDALFYYLLGAAGTRCRRLVETERIDVGAGMGVASGVTALLCACLRGASGALPGQVILGTVLQRGGMAAAVWFLLPGRYLKPAAGYMKQGFFVYATHYAVIRLLYRLLRSVMAGSMVLRLGLYLLMPLICVWAAWLGGMALRRVTPLLWKILSGGR